MSKWHRTLQILWLCGGLLTGPLAGCGPIDAEPAVTSTRNQFNQPPMLITPLQSHKSVPLSSCNTSIECEKACNNNDHNACTRWADELLDRVPDKASALYQKACKSNDRIGCERLMEISGHDLVLANRFASQACSLGSPQACALVSEAAALAYEAPRSGENQMVLLAFAGESAKRGCQLGSFSACINAAAIAGVRFGNRTNNRTNIRAWQERARELAKTACIQRDSTACEFVAGKAEQSNDLTSAGVYYNQLCHLTRIEANRRLDGGVQRFEDLPACTRAAELLGGLDVVKNRGLAPLPPRAKFIHLVSTDVVAAQRIFGTTQIRVPAEERATLGVRTVRASIQVCVSERGRPSQVRFVHASSLPGWNRALFEAIRAWRYTPFKLDDQRVPVCTVVSFVFATQQS